MSNFLYAEEVTVDKVIGLTIGLFFQFWCLFVIHIIITKVGMIFVDAETVRVGNDTILNSIEEGVVILGEAENKVHFANTSAQKFNVKHDSSFVMSLDRDDEIRSQA